MRVPGRMKSLTGLSNAVTAFFGAMILVNLASVMSRWTLIDFLEGIVAGRVPDMARAEEIDAAAEKLGIAGIAVGVGFIVTFCIWFHRAHANLRAAKLPKLEYGSGWAVGGFFVPILNLVRPFQVMKEVWLGTSFLAGAAHVTHWKRGPSTPLIGWWWALFLVSSRLGHMALRIFLRSSSASSLITAGWAEIASDVVGIAAAFLGITLVRRISELQERARWRKS